MKKIVFCLQTMVLGGVEKELITVMKRLSPEDFDITLLLMYVTDKKIMEEIPSYVRIIDLNIDQNYYCAPCVSLCKQRLKRGKVFEASQLMLKRVMGIGMTYSNTNLSAIESLQDNYDIAICYHIHSPLTLRYVAEKVSASKRIAWIHNDFLTTGYAINKLKKWLDKYTEIVAVSKQVELEFRELCPGYEDKLYMCHNIVDEDSIQQKANELVDDKVFTEEQSPRLLTIGRFVEQKGFDYAIEAARILKEQNTPFKWYFIGYGEDQEKYEKLIADYKLEDSVIILGRRDNPYPYIKNCTIYIQPSRHEAYGLVVNEARILHKPIICSRFAGAEEQIADKVNGRIVEIGDTDALADTIKELLTYSELCEAYSRATNTTVGSDWDNIIARFD